MKLSINPKKTKKRKNRRCPNFPGSFPPSIFSARELNFCVRDGYRCILSAIITGFSSIYLKAVPSKLNNVFQVFKTIWSSPRPISTSQLNALLHLHLWPINVIVSHGSYHFWGKSYLEGGFALRCFQRLSRPYLATRLCPWQNNRCTRGMSIPVLSY